VLEHVCAENGRQARGATIRTRQSWAEKGDEPKNSSLTNCNGRKQQIKFLSYNLVTVVV